MWRIGAWQANKRQKQHKRKHLAIKAAASTGKRGIRGVPT